MGCAILAVLFARFMRPPGVSLVAIYQILRGIMGLVFGLFVAVFVGPANKFAAVSKTGNVFERHVGHLGHLAGLAVILFAIAHIIAGYGVWLLRNWGRYVTILFSAAELALIISRVSMNAFALPVGVLNAACIFCLAMPPVRGVFRTQTHRSV